MSDVIYLACPYTHPDPEIRTQRFDLANRLAGRLIREGQVVFSPLSHSHPITETGLPVEWEFWREHCLALLSLCSRMIVYCLDGWEQSVGVRAEVAWMHAHGRPVYYHHPEIDHLCASASPRENCPDETRAEPQRRGEEAI